MSKKVWKYNGKTVLWANPGRDGWSIFEGGTGSILTFLWCDENWITTEAEDKSE